MRKGFGVYALGVLLVFTLSGCSIMKESRINAECVEKIDKSLKASDKKAAEAGCAESAEAQVKVDRSYEKGGLCGVFGVLGVLVCMAIPGALD